MKENDRKNPRIRFNINKSEEEIANGITFVNEIIKIINDFGIKTTEICLYTKKPRKDGTKVKEIRFRVITGDNNRFIKYFAPFFSKDYKKSFIEDMG